MRHKLAALALLLFASPAVAQQPDDVTWKPADGEKLVFDVYRDGGKFGRHVVSFRREGDRLTVASDIELKVAIGPLAVFHYVHKATETYDGGKLAFLTARTKKDGKWVEVAAEATAGGLKIAGAAFKGVKAGVAIPSTHWNLAEMRQAAMLSTETGAMLPMQVTDKGIEKVKTSSGQIDARHYRVKSEMDASFWYDATGRWVGCAFKAQGSNVTYVLREAAD